MPDYADTILLACVFTADAGQPRAEAVAVHGRRILFVGSAEDADRFRGRATRVIDGRDCTLLPGFIDSHFHLLHGSEELGNIQLQDVGGMADLEAVVHSYAAANPDLPFLSGFGLSYAVLPDQTLTRRQLDAILPDRPLILFAYDGHTAWANTPALELGGILNGGEAGPNAEIVVDADGTASGELREPGAFDPIKDLIPEPDDNRRRALLREGLAEAARQGITGVHNMGGDRERMAFFAAMEDLDELTLRVYCPVNVWPDTPLEALAEAAELRNVYQGGMLRAGSLKFFMDGVVESYTALLLDEYADRPGWLGDAHYSADLFNRFAVEADRLGLQIFVHAIGDGAVRRTLDGFEAAREANGPRDSRHRVEHIELIHPDDLPRFAELGVIASMQPLHSPMQVDGSDVWPERVGADRWGRSFAWAALRQAGARLVFGSDWPVASQSVMAGIHAAVTRPPWAEGLPDQHQLLSDALLSYTLDGAYAEFQEGEKGQLKAGMLADLVLLSDDIFSIPPAALADVRPLLTMCDGRIVYEA
jgi:predicted amidohydrolase YtcJ